MVVKKISRWEIESASRTARGDQRDQWHEHAKMTLSVAPVVQGKRVVHITAPGGAHTWFLAELIDTLIELRDESPEEPRFQIKD